MNRSCLRIGRGKYHNLPGEKLGSSRQVATELICISSGQLNAVSKLAGNDAIHRMADD